MGAEQSAAGAAGPGGSGPGRPGARNPGGATAQGAAAAAKLKRGAAGANERATGASAPHGQGAACGAKSGPASSVVHPKSGSTHHAAHARAAAGAHRPPPGGAAAPTSSFGLHITHADASSAPDPGSMHGEQPAGIIPAFRPGAKLKGAARAAALGAVRVARLSGGGHKEAEAAQLGVSAPAPPAPAADNLPVPPEIVVPSSAPTTPAKPGGAALAPTRFRAKCLAPTCSAASAGASAASAASTPERPQNVHLAHAGGAGVASLLGVAGGLRSPAASQASADSFGTSVSKKAPSSTLLGTGELNSINFADAHLRPYVPPEKGITLSDMREFHERRQNVKLAQYGRAFSEMSALDQALCFNRILHFDQEVGRMISGAGRFMHCTDLPSMLEEAIRCTKAALSCARVRVFEVDYANTTPGVSVRTAEGFSLLLVAGESGLIGQPVSMLDFAGRVCHADGARAINRLDLKGDARYGEAYRYMEQVSKFTPTSLIGVPVRAPHRKGRPRFVIEAYNKERDADFDEADCYVLELIAEAVAAAAAWIRNATYASLAAEFTDTVLQTHSLYDFDCKACEVLTRIFECEEACVYYVDGARDAIWRFADARNEQTGRQHRVWFGRNTRSIATHQLERALGHGRKRSTASIGAAAAAAPASAQGSGADGAEGARGAETPVEAIAGSADVGDSDSGSERRGRGRRGGGGGGSGDESDEGSSSDSPSASGSAAGDGSARGAERPAAPSGGAAQRAAHEQQQEQKAHLSATVVNEAERSALFNADIDKSVTLRCRNLMVVAIFAVREDGSADSARPLAVVQLRNRIANINIHKHMRSSGAFRSSDVAQLSAFARQAASAFEQALEMERAREAELVQLTAEGCARAVMELANTLAAENPTHDLYGVVVRQCVQLLSAERASVLLIEADRLVAQHALGLDDEQLSVPLKETSIAGFCCVNKTSALVDDAYRDKRFDPTVDKRTGYRTRHMLCVPIVDHSTSKVLGCLQVINKRDEEGKVSAIHTFTRRDLGVAEAFAAVMAVTISHKQLQEDAFEQAARVHREAMEQASPVAHRGQRGHRRSFSASVIDEIVGAENAQAETQLEPPPARAKHAAAASAKRASPPTAAPVAAGGQGLARGGAARTMTKLR